MTGPEERHRQFAVEHDAAAASTPLVSILTPAYNEEKDLAQCIESVLTQTYTNWDYLIVNNQSTDRTLAIAEEYARTDERIRVHTNREFLPVMGNFNTAFRQISPQAKYCKVVGGDDWIYPRCLESLVAVGERYPSAAIIGAYSIYGEMIEPVGPPFPTELVPGSEACANYLMGKPYFFGTPTTLLYRSDIVRSRTPFFEEDHLHADLTACLESLKDRDFAFCHEVLSFNRKREGSLTATAQLYNRYVLEHLAVLERFGPVYLDKAEMRKQIRWKWAALYKGLGQRVLQGHDRKFWRSQRLQTAAFGHRINRARVGMHAGLCLLDTAVRKLRW